MQIETLFKMMKVFAFIAMFEVFVLLPISFALDYPLKKEYEISKIAKKNKELKKKKNDNNNFIINTEHRKAIKHRRLKNRKAQ